MDVHYEIDNLDKNIIRILQENARVAFTDIAKKLLVSSGTIHQRYEKLKEAGIITGSKIIVDESRLGVGVEIVLGIHVINAKDIHTVISKLSRIHEIVEVNYMTGPFALMAKIYAEDINHFHDLLVNKIQSINEIQSTDSLICLDTPIKREYSFQKS